MNNEFLRDLKRVYLEIDKFSNLTWSMRDNFEFINNGRSNTRSRISDKDKEDSAKWQQETNAQLGYGEITRVSTKLTHFSQSNLLAFIFKILI